VDGVIAPGTILCGARAAFAAEKRPILIQAAIFEIDIGKNFPDQRIGSRYQSEGASGHRYQKSVIIHLSRLTPD
jgi:hypothetical protein